MDEKKFYKIKRSGGKPKTTWIGATGCKRVFDEGQDTFIVNEVELGICLHNGNFKLMGPAPASEIPSQPVKPQPTEAAPKSLTEPKIEPVVESVDENKEDTKIEE